MDEAGTEHHDTTASMSGRPPGQQRPVRVLISYAHDDREHTGRVRDLWVFLRTQGIDARLDLPAAEHRVDWALWMTRQIRDADRILVIASPEYRRRAEGDAPPEKGRGVQWEARLIRDLFYADPDAGLDRIIPVILPDGSPGDIPLWLARASSTHYQVHEYTTAGAETLLRLLTRQPFETTPPLGNVPVLPSRAQYGPAPVTHPPGLHTEVLIQARLDQSGVLESAVWVAGTLLCQRREPLPFEVHGVWNALQLPGLTAGERMADAGRKLAITLLDAPARQVLTELLEQLPLGATADVILAAEGQALSLPVELMRLADTAEAGPRPLGLLAGVSIYRHQPGTVIPGSGWSPLQVLAMVPGPLKILAAVAAPDETMTRSVPLDTEAEMDAVLDAVTDAAASPHAQVRILEVASLPAIRQALAADAYHVLHLSAHGSPQMIELEDEDGNPVAVTPADLMQALKHAGRPVPLIVLSSCSGGAAGTTAMAAELITGGAQRVIAMLAPVTDHYATELARHLYRELAAHPELTVGQALARARYLTRETRSRASVGKDHVPAPEYGVPTLLTAGRDGPLVEPVTPEAPLTVVTRPPGGRGVRELPLGALIGRRTQLRTAMGVLRRTGSAVERHGTAGGIVLTGIGGIGKTALAGRVVSRLGDDGWLITVHEGRWNPTALINETVHAISETLAHAGAPQESSLRACLARLTDPSSDDGPKIAAIADMLASHRLLALFDDFEQNLTPGGDTFLDPSTDEAIAGLAEAAETGALLFTCRYPLPGPDRFLVTVPVPALSPAELRRMFLRLPALRDLDTDDKRLLIRTIGGHPRLIEFTDALLRGGHASLRHIQVKLRDLASHRRLPLTTDGTLQTALDHAMVLGSADILLTGLLGLLSPAQADVLLQVAVCHGHMTLDDLAFALTPATQNPGSQPGGTSLRADVDRLTDLTLLTPGTGIVMHPWTAALVIRNTPADLTQLHERALAMRFRRSEQGRGSYEDLIDIPRHLAALHRYDDIPDIADQAITLLPGTLATVAYLAEIRPLIPPADRAWVLIANLEVKALSRRETCHQPPRSCGPSTSRSRPGPPPTPPTPDGSTTSPSATTNSGTSRSPPGTLAAPAPPTRPASTSGHAWPPPTPPTPNGSGTSSTYAKSSISFPDHRSCEIVPSVGKPRITITAAAGDTVWPRPL